MANVRDCTAYEIWKAYHCGPWFDYLCAHHEVSCFEDDPFFNAIIWG
jgi:hypothetical protein